MTVAHFVFARNFMSNSRFVITEERYIESYRPFFDLSCFSYTGSFQFARIIRIIV